jgi:phospholipid/cholesterol/gamma-HCH transport system ATP-binding protein
MKIMVGLIRPDTGKVYYDGHAVQDMNNRELRELRQKLGMLFQAGALFDSQTVYQNIAFPLVMFTNRSKKEIDFRVQECLEQVDLPGTDKLFTNELSGGMRKRVALARAFALQPRYLFVDEPNSGLDPLTAGRIDELIRKLTLDYNTTTVVISHDMKSVKHIADHLMFIHEGKNDWEGPVTEMFHTYTPRLREFLEISGVFGKELFAEQPKHA